MNIFRGAIGLCFIVSIAYAFSADRKNIDWRLVASGIFIQLVIGLLIAKVAIIGSFFGFISDKFIHFLNFALGGAEFLFGDLAKNSDQASDAKHSLGFLFAFQALPIIVFFSSIMVLFRSPTARLASPNSSALLHRHITYVLHLLHKTPSLLLTCWTILGYP